MDSITETLEALQRASSMTEAHCILSEFADQERRAAVLDLIGSTEAATIWRIGRQRAAEIIAAMPEARQIGREWIVSRYDVERYQRAKPGRKSA